MSGFAVNSTFIQEAEDLLAQIEEISLGLDENTVVGEDVHKLFRAFHTIKGSSSMFGLTEIAGFTHHVETVLDMVRDGSVPITQQLVTLVLGAKDEIKALLDASQSGQSTPANRRESIIADLNTLYSSPTIAPDHGNQVAPSSNLISKSETFKIRFLPQPEILLMGTNPAALFAELKALGTCEVVADTSRIPPLAQLTPDHCYFGWKIILTTEQGINAIKDVFIFVEDCCELKIEKVATEELSSVPMEVESDGNVAMFAPGEVQKTAGVAPAPEVIAKTPSVPAVVEQPSNTGKAQGNAGPTIRVPSEKLDRLVSLVGELVTSQSRLSQVASKFEGSELAAPVEEIERLVSELRENVLGIRMMPIGTTFGRFKRLVHDLSHELNKEIDLVTEGAETEVDKTVLDQLGDPLVHLIRNSLDHGIETAEQRVEKGKSRRGTIRLSAAHVGSNVVVKIQDDGRGLDKDAIRAKAIEKKLIAADAILTDKEIFNLIFLPGFSTAKQVTSISGRGVGMDVVKRQIEGLRGSIEITSQIGHGTTISLTLPLTLAIIDGLLVEIDGDRFIIPMASVTENVELTALDRARSNSRNVVAVRGELISYIRLRELFGIEGEAPFIEKIVIAQHGDQRVGVVVDRVLGSHQTVIQSLGRFYRNVGIASGATIMGDGGVALILDLGGLVRHAERPITHLQSARTIAAA